MQSTLSKHFQDIKFEQQPSYRGSHREDDEHLECNDDSIQRLQAQFTDEEADTYRDLVKKSDHVIISGNSKVAQRTSSTGVIKSLGGNGISQTAKGNDSSPALHQHMKNAHKKSFGVGSRSSNCGTNDEDETLNLQERDETTTGDVFNMNPLFRKQMLPNATHQQMSSYAIKN